MNNIKNMKKMLYTLAGVLLFTACGKDPVDDHIVIIDPPDEVLIPDPDPDPVTEPTVTATSTTATSTTETSTTETSSSTTASSTTTSSTTAPDPEVYTKSFINIRDEVYKTFGGYIAEDWNDIQGERDPGDNVGFKNDPVYSQFDFYDTSTWIDVFVQDALRNGVDLREYVETRNISVEWRPNQGIWTGDVSSEDVIVTVGGQLLGEMVERINTYGIEYAGNWYLNETFITIWHEIGHAMLKYRHTCEIDAIMSGCYSVEFPSDHERHGEYIPLEDGVRLFMGNSEYDQDDVWASRDNEYEWFKAAATRMFNGDGMLSNAAVYPQSARSPIERTNYLSNRE